MSTVDVNSQGVEIESISEAYLRDILGNNFESAVTANNVEESCSGSSKGFSESEENDANNTSTSRMRLRPRFIQKRKRQSTSTLENYYEYLGHDASPEARNGDSRKSNKRPYKVLCTYCDTEVCGHDSAPSRITGHLKKYHHIEVDIGRNVQTRNQFPRSHRIQQMFDDAFTNFIITAGIPFASLNNKFLRRSLQILQPSVRPLSYKVFAQKIETTCNEKVVPFLRWSLKDVTDLTLILDCWSTRYLDSVLCIQVCYFDSDLSLKRRTVAVIRLVGRHTWDNIRNRVITEMESLEILHKVQ
ncbi:unnamed protein product [Allacma fusca]|uniref:BED-type domain-containing protein n=1 Tax=Allacma fusca TaxID=39272 RepID=A0A8J2KAE1_9HEXA|nr:unnamed protein product [Allacma fusca]